ncbi:MAG: hypothetical protein MUO60_18825, partial [Clostridiaceae bacterium]|nr:hypothetical protein [Clostridiaceae bacterium]
ALENRIINKIAFATHINNIESKNMMEKMNFKLKETQILAIKNISSLDSNIYIEDFHIENWDITYEEFENLNYIKKRNGLLPLAFAFEQVTFELYESLKANNSFVKINGHYGLFKYKGEVNFIAMEDTFEGINTFMDYYLLKYKKSGVQEIFTPVYPKDKALIEELKSSGYTSWFDWKPDYLYYIGEK